MAMGSATEREHGFSLLETIIALVILAMSLATLFQAYGDGLRAISAGNRHAEARILAQSLLAEIADPAQTGRLNGSRNGLHWRRDIKPATGDLTLADTEKNTQLFEVMVTVRWAPRRRIVLRSLRLGPAS